MYVVGKNKVMKTVFERIKELELTLWSARKHIKKRKNV